MLFIMAVTLYTSRIVLKTLGVVDYGLYNVVGGIVTMFTFLNGSMGAATSRFITFALGKEDFDGLKKIFNIALEIHIAIAIIIIFLAETIGLWFFYEKMTIPAERLDAAFWVYQISILTAFFSLTQVPYNATIIAHENMKIYAYVGIYDAVMKLLIVYLLPKSPIDKLIYYAILLFLVTISVQVFYRYYCIKHYSETAISFCKDKKLLKEMFGFGISDMIGNIAVLAQGQGLNLLLNVFFGPAVNAARAIAYQVQGAITRLSDSFITAVKPQIIKLYAQNQIKEMMSLVSTSSRFSFYLMWLVALPIILEADYILTLWLGEYPDHTVSFFYLIMILCLIQTLKSPRTTVFHATGHIMLANLTVGSVLCAAFPLAYVLLKKGSNPESVFWAANISMILSEFVSVFILKKYISYNATKYMFSVHGLCIIVAAVSGIIPFLLFDKLMEPSFLRLITTCLITTISIVITCWTIGMDKAMRSKIKGIVLSKLNRW